MGKKSELTSELRLRTLADSELFQYDYEQKLKKDRQYELLLDEVVAILGHGESVMNRKIQKCTVPDNIPPGVEELRSGCIVVQGIRNCSPEVKYFQLRDNFDREIYPYYVFTYLNFETYESEVWKDCEDVIDPQRKTVPISRFLDKITCAVAALEKCRMHNRKNADSMFGNLIAASLFSMQRVERELIVTKVRLREHLDSYRNSESENSESLNKYGSDDGNTFYWLSDKIFVLLTSLRTLQEEYNIVQKRSKRLSFAGLRSFLEKQSGLVIERYSLETLEKPYYRLVKDSSLRDEDPALTLRLRQVFLAEQHLW